MVWKMVLEFVRTDSGLIVPHIGGKLAFPLVNYLIYQSNTPIKRGGTRELQTLENIYSYMKIWFDYCLDLGLGYEMVTYEVHLQAFHSSLKKRGLKSGSYNNYYRAWRNFYEWCDSEGIPHLMRFPAKHTIGNRSYVGYGNGSKFVSFEKVEVDPGLESTGSVSDYKEKILNHEDFEALSEELNKQDPVFKHIAYMMVTTGLRVGGVIQIPVGANALNPEWLRYPDLQKKGVNFQKLVYIPKGRKRKLECLVLTEALGVLHNNYITQDRPKRADLFRQKKGNHGLVPLWLNVNGKEVYLCDIWAAFRAASKVLGRHITPHFLRHTYASYIVYYYFKANGLSPNLAYTHDIHEQLRIQLGHCDVETTKKYIRTVISVKMEIWLPLLTPYVQQVVDMHLPEQVLAGVTRFFEPHVDC